MKGNLKDWCEFCRVPLHSSDEEYRERLEKRIKLGDAEAFNQLGHKYYWGDDKGLPTDKKKAYESWNTAAGLESTRARHSIANSYYKGEGVEKDMNKALHHYKLAAIGGHESARYVVGMIEGSRGNINSAMKHHMIAAKSGYDDSLKMVGEGYKAGHVMKNDYASTLCTYQSSRDEMKSEQRFKATVLIARGEQEQMKKANQSS